jgi:predicted small secreted protein
MKRTILLMLLAAVAALALSGCSILGGALSDTGRTIQKAGDSMKRY